ncbi:MAG TPA: ATP12 family protein [Rhizomicrobium sp.]|jgi:chaperone required for assembly of F1-ATPase
MKRFYKDVSIAEENSSFRVLLDGRTLKTQAKATLAMPTRTLAEAVAEEWRAQGEDIDPPNMFLTRLCFAAIDGVKADRAKVADHALSYGASDLLCYRAEYPEELHERQAATWDPLLDWAAQRHGARLKVAHGIVFHEQPTKALAGLQEAIDAQDDFALAALHNAATITGSLVIALALVDGHLTAEEAFSAATLDDAFQSEKWGTDEEAQLRLKRLAAELSAAERFLRLLA